MAFMMPVVKNDYNIYPSCPSTKNGMGTPQTSSRGSSLSSSPTGASSSFMSSPRNSRTPAFVSTPKSGSQVSLHKFHSKLLDKLKKTFRSKDDDGQGSSSASSTIAIR